MRFLSTVCFSLVMLCFLQSCHEDAVEEVEIIDSYTPYTIYEVDVRGLISNSDGDPITEAELEFNGDTRISDGLGYFLFEGVGADTKNAVLRVTAEGFIPVTRLISVLSPTTIQLNITLIPLPDVESFNAEDGKVVIVSDHAQITFYPNGILKNGVPFSGNVNIKTYHLAKDDVQLFNKLPGDLVGIDQQLDVKVLETYGMLYATLEDDEGNELQPDPRLTAQLTIDIPLAYQAQAPSEIPLWYFDEQRGLWIEDGKAIRENNTYIGSVTHFSWWNIDLPLNDLVTVCLSASDANTGQALINTDILFTSEEVEFGLQSTNSEGQICLSLPAQQIITLSLANSCQEVSNVDIGPFDASTDNVPVELGIDDSKTIMISGNLTDCDGEATQADILTVSRDGTRSVIDLNNDASFNYSLVCPVDNERIFFGAYDKATGHSVSKEYMINVDEQSSQFDLTVCGSDGQNIIVGTISGEDIFLLIESVKLNPNETILVIENSCYLSFLGSSTGTFEGVYFCMGAGPNSKVNVMVTSFGDKIEGTFSGNNSSGTFSASNN